MSILCSYLDQTGYFISFGTFTEYFMRSMMVLVPMIVVVYIPLKRFKLCSLVKDYYLSTISQTKDRMG